MSNHLDCSPPSTVSTRGGGGAHAHACVSLTSPRTRGGATAAASQPTNGHVRADGWPADAHVHAWPRRGDAHRRAADLGQGLRGVRPRAGRRARRHERCDRRARVGVLGDACAVDCERNDALHVLLCHRGRAHRERLPARCLRRHLAGVPRRLPAAAARLRGRAAARAHYQPGGGGRSQGAHARRDLHDERDASVRAPAPPEPARAAARAKVRRRSG